VTRHLASNWPCIVGFGCLLFSATGCTNFWDEVTSHERDWDYAFNRKPSPMTVIQKNPDGAPGSDGDRRAEAFSRLEEPLQHGGDAKDEDAYLSILGTAAKMDSEPTCRLTAIRTLGRFKDPRAARILEEVYQLPVRRPGVQDNGQVLFFTADINSKIRKEALVGLAKIHDDGSHHFLATIARQPGPPAIADLEDRQETQDQKTVAIRALGFYRQQECIDALKYVLRTEKDIALRNRAAESLEQATGKRWPIDLEPWQKAGDPQPLPPEGFIEKAGHYTRLPF
jgi:hypothetical protein